MTAGTLTLTDFLLARIADDEEIARRKVGTGFHRFAREPYPDGRQGGRIGYWLEDWQGSGFIDVTEHVARHDPARVLAECEAKRRIVELHVLRMDTSSWPETIPVCTECGPDEDVKFRVGLAGNHPCPTLRALALPYADHADYDEAWRP